MKKLIIIIIMLSIIAPIFAQRSESGRGSRRRRSPRSIVQTDPNNQEDNSWKEDLPVLPKKDDVRVKKEKTLEDRVKELEYQVEELERMIIILKDDTRILRELFQNSKSLNYEKSTAKKKEAKRRENRTEEERDRVMGIYPFQKKKKYGPKKNSDEYNDGYYDGYNDAYYNDYGSHEINSWEDNETDSEVIDSEVDNGTNVKEK